MLVGIWAQDKNGLIGKDGNLPWHLPDDLKRFKMLTQGNVLVMGRKTYDGMGKRPLPNRETIVLTHDTDYDPEHEDVKVMHSTRQVLKYAEKVKSKKTIYIGGGSGVFKEFEPYMDKLMRTVILEEFDGDAYFPADFDFSKFKMVKARKGVPDEKNKYAYRYETLVRINDNPEVAPKKKKPTRAVR